MAFLEILGLVMQIINFILGIFIPPTPTGAVPTQYNCATIKWTQAPKVVSGELIGTVQQSCKFEARSGGGLNQLKQHLAQAVERDASVIYTGPIQTVASGQSSTQYAVALKADASDADVETRGNSSIVTTANSLRHSFNQTSVYSASDAKYVSGVKADMEVTPSAEAHWYNITVTTSIKVKKPWFVTAGYFQGKIVSGIEKQMPERVVEAMNEMASHL